MSWNSRSPCLSTGGTAHSGSAVSGTPWIRNVDMCSEGCAQRQQRLRLSSHARVVQAGSWPYAPPQDFTEAPRIDAYGAIHPALAMPARKAAAPATAPLTPVGTSAPAASHRRPYTVGDWTPSPPSNSPPGGGTPTGGTPGKGGGVAAEPAAMLAAAVGAGSAWAAGAAARSGRAAVVRLPPIPASNSGGSATADSGHIAGESALLEQARDGLGATAVATRGGASSAALADSSLRLRQYVRSLAAYQCGSTHE